MRAEQIRQRPRRLVDGEREQGLQSLKLIGRLAGAVLRHCRALPLRELRDIRLLHPALGVYLTMARRYERTRYGLALSQEIRRRVRGEGAARTFAATWQAEASSAHRRLTDLGVLLTSGIGLWALDHLRTTFSEEACEAERRHSRDQVLRATRSFDEELRTVRRQLQGRGEDLDPSALFEAYQTAGAAAAKAVEGFVSDSSRLLHAKGIAAVLQEMPLVPYRAISRHTQSMLRAAYVAEAPHHRDVPLTSLRPATSQDEEESSDEEFLARIAEMQAAGPDLSAGVLDAITRTAEASRLRERIRRELTQVRQEALLEYWQALEDGYRPAGKLGQSLRQYWGAHYGRKQRMLHRLRDAHPQLVADVERLGLGK
jgi:hypothetical protein